MKRVEVIRVAPGVSGTNEKDRDAHKWGRAAAASTRRGVIAAGGASMESAFARRSEMDRLEQKRLADLERATARKRECRRRAARAKRERGNQ